MSKTFPDGWQTDSPIDQLGSHQVPIVSQEGSEWILFRQSDVVFCTNSRVLYVCCDTNVSSSLSTVMLL